MENGLPLTPPKEGNYLSEEASLNPSEGGTFAKREAKKICENP
jgi:hypothetical protein